MLEEGGDGKSQDVDSSRQDGAPLDKRANLVRKIICAPPQLFPTRRFRSTHKPVHSSSPPTRPSAFRRRTQRSGGRLAKSRSRAGGGSLVDRHSRRIGRGKRCRRTGSCRSRCTAKGGVSNVFFRSASPPWDAFRAALDVNSPPYPDMKGKQAAPLRNPSQIIVQQTHGQARIPAVDRPLAERRRDRSSRSEHGEDKTSHS